MGARTRRFTSLASGSGKATAVVVCAVMLLAGCSGSGGSATVAGAPVVRGDVAGGGCEAAKNSWTATAAVGGVTRTVVFTAPTYTSPWTTFTATANTGQSATISTSASRGSIQVRGLTKKANNTFIVTGTTANGCTYMSPPSITVSGVVEAVAAPGVPTISTVTAGDAKVTVTVAAATTGGTPASYAVTASPAVTGGSCTVTGESGSCDVTDLTNGTAYTFTATATNAGGTATSSASSPVTPMAAQTTLTVSNTTLTGPAGTNIALETLGGSGTGTLTFTVTGTGCSLIGTSLRATVAATCIVTAKKAASTGYLEATSEPKTFTFTAAPVAQATLTVSNTTLTGTAGTNIALETSGGSGDGAVTFAVTGAGCTVTGTSLNATSGGNCGVTATKAASTGYLAATSWAKIFAFTGPQATLSVVNTTLTGSVGTVIPLTATGGSGMGALTFTVTGTGCSLIGSSLRATVAATCIVTAKKAASTYYLAATSAPTTFTFIVPVAQARLSVTNTSLTGTVGRAITLTTSGGSGDGAVTFTSTGAGACTASYVSLTATKEGVCGVIAKKAASPGYNEATSELVRFTFWAGGEPQTASNTLRVSNASTQVLSSRNFASTLLDFSGGRGEGSVTFTVEGSGCSVYGTGRELTGNVPSFCIVRANKAAWRDYPSETSQPVTFEFKLSR